MLLADKVGFLDRRADPAVRLFSAFGVRRNVAIVPAIVATLVIHFAFYKLLRVPLPWGVLQAVRVLSAAWTRSLLAFTHGLRAVDHRS